MQTAAYRKALLRVLGSWMMLNFWLNCTWTISFFFQYWYTKPCTDTAIISNLWSRSNISTWFCISPFYTTLFLFSGRLACFAYMNLNNITFHMKVLIVLYSTYVPLFLVRFNLFKIAAPLSFSFLIFTNSTVFFSSRFITALPVHFKIVFCSCKINTTLLMEWWQWWIK